MISLITKYILFIQLIFNSFTTFSISVKTFQVQRINESAYLVTSLPEFETENHKRFSNKKTKNKIVPLNDKKHTDDYDFKMSSVTVGEKRDKLRHKPVSAEFIKKVRERYFRTYYATIKKSSSLLPEKLNPFLLDITNSSTIKTAKFQHNLLTARKIALLLFDQLQPDVKRRDIFFDVIKRRKRNKCKKRRSNKPFLSGLSWRPLHTRQSRKLNVLT